MNRWSPARRWRRILFLIVTATLAGSGAVLAAGPLPALHPPAADGRLDLSDTDRCPVCAMFPARRPTAAAAMTLTDGKAYYFCANGCLLRAWLRPGAYLGPEAAAIARVVVQEYFSGRPLEGHRAIWVAGSDVVGPMGAAIVALADADTLATFQRRHGGQIVFTLDQLDDDLWRRIGGKPLPEAGVR